MSRGARIVVGVHGSPSADASDTVRAGHRVGRQARGGLPRPPGGGAAPLRWGGRERGGAAGRCAGARPRGPAPLLEPPGQTPSRPCSARRSPSTRPPARWWPPRGTTRRRMRRAISSGRCWRTGSTSPARATPPSATMASSPPASSTRSRAPSMASVCASRSVTSWPCPGGRWRTSSARRGTPTRPTPASASGSSPRSWPATSTWARPASTCALRGSRMPGRTWRSRWPRWWDSSSTRRACTPRPGSA